METAAEPTEALAARVTRELGSQGYSVLPGFLHHDQLEELRLEADTLYEVGEEERQACGSSGAAVAPAAAARWGVHAATSCIYESLPGHSCSAELRSSYAAYQAARSCWPLRPAVWRLLFQSQLAQLALGVLGGAAVLFNDQYILKPPGSAGSAFQWHRDSDWCRGDEGVAYSPYISVWVALDDMTAANGCFVVHPSGPAQQQAQQHAQHQQQRQQQQQQQAAAGIPLEVPAGTAVVTADTLLHCSGPNRSPHMRRAWMPQFSAAPIRRRGSAACVSLAIPLQPPAGQTGDVYGGAV